MSHFARPVIKFLILHTIMNPESMLVRLLTQKHVKNEISMKSMIHFMHEFYSAQFLQDPFYPLSNFEAILFFLFFSTLFYATF